LNSINIKIILTNYTNKLNFFDNLTEKARKDCKCLSLATSSIFIIYSHLSLQLQIWRIICWLAWVLTSGIYSIHPLHHGLSARRCPMSSHFLTRCVSRLLGLGLVSWAFARFGVHRLSLRLPYLGVFPFTFLHLPLDFIRVSSFTTDVSAPIGRPLSYSLFRW